MPSALTGPQPPNDDVWRSWTIAVARVSGVCVGGSADVGSAPPPTRARCPHSDSAISTTNFWPSPSPGTSPQSAPPLRSTQAPLNGVVGGHKANLAFSPADFLLQNDDVFSISWHTSTGPAWPVLRPRAAPGLADALRFLASLGWRLPLALRPASPTSFYPCGLAHPSPDAFCVFRRLLEGQRRRPHLHDGVLRRPCTTTGDLHQPPLRGVTPHSASAYLVLRTTPSGNAPVSRKRHNAMSTWRATATLPIRLQRLPPLP